MLTFLNRLQLKARETKYKYLFLNSNIRISPNSSLTISSTAKVKSSIILSRGSTVSIGNNCEIRNARIDINNGELIVEDGTIIRDCHIEINDGKIHISHHSKIQCRHLWVRFGGKLSIGSYTNLNQGTEVRADELVQIGSYCQISYNVNIWDTNTHNILPAGERKRLAEQHFPKFGHEESRPLTKPVIIGDFCWIGEYATILKGTTLGDNVIVGYHTLLSGQHIKSSNKVVQNTDIKII